MQIRSALQILSEVRDGFLVSELSTAIHEAVAAVKEHGKPAKIMVELTIAPMRKGAEKLMEAPMIIVGEVSSKLPQADPEATLFFEDTDGNLTRVPERKQQDLGLKVAKGE